ncbi:MAG: hypothetical protein DCC68_22655 [Planctomycetota bacterium]|nr:MAG: hypothetical protein DCC68_22655 [Planctomycetota bacterium]
MASDASSVDVQGGQCKPVIKNVALVGSAAADFFAGSWAATVNVTASAPTVAEIACFIMAKLSLMYVAWKMRDQMLLLEHRTKTGSVKPAPIRLTESIHRQ